MDDLRFDVIPEKSRNKTSFDLGELRGPWEAYLARNNLKAGEVLRQVVQQLSGADAAFNADHASPKVTKLEKPYSVAERTERKERRHRVYLSLTPSEYRAVEERCRADGFDQVTSWAVALVRSQLTQEPQFSRREIEALGESNHQLLAIGRNLNQIAHALNATRGKSVDSYDREMVSELADAVKRHVRKVGDALRASIYRWTLESD